MRGVTIDGTALRVSRWSFGTASLHHRFRAGERQRILDSAADAGFSHFDTAPLYGDGLAEIDLGRFLRGRRDRFTVATKVGLYPTGGTAGSATALWLRRGWRRVSGRDLGASAEWAVDAARASLDASLRRLRTDYVDLLLLHEPDPALIDAAAFARWLQDEAARGRIRVWGLAGAGVAGLGWIGARSPLARVLQVKDSVAGREADAVSAAGRKPQFTYGYLAASTGARERDLQAILQRNRDGSIIVSSRRSERIRAFAKAAELESWN